MTELGTGATPRSTGYAAAIHDNGRIVGSYGQPDQAAEFRDDGSVVLLPIPTGYTSCVALGIADDGTIAGNCSLPDLNTHVFTWDAAGVAHPLLESPPGVYDGMGEMNRHGVILGVTTGGPDAGYWTYDLRTGERTEIPLEDGVSGRALGLNDEGDIVGFIDISGESKPVLWSGDPLVATVLATPPGCRGIANDINNHGVIVGSVCVLVNEKPVVWSSASAVPEELPAPRAVPGAFMLEMGAYDINDDGVAIGMGMQYAGDVASRVGVAWTAQRRMVDLGGVAPFAINAAGVIVGSGATRQPVRIELMGAE